jgi:hypothetical protein
MLNSLNSDRGRYWVLLPYLYNVATRVDRKQVVYNTAMAWLPAAWLAFRYSDLALPELAAGLAFGYLAFISIYEIGYLLNDTWGAAREAGGRERARFRTDAAYVAAFVLLRLAFWLTVGIVSGWIFKIDWLVFYAALVAILVCHNIIHTVSFRTGTFLQLSVLRFVAPLLPLVDVSQLPLIMLLGVLHYSYFRFLSYLNAKKLLRMEQRESLAFGAIYIALITPFDILLSTALRDMVPLEIWFYFLCVYVAWSVVYPKGRLLSGRDLAPAAD